MPATVNRPTPASKSRRVLLLLSWYSAATHEGIARYAREAGWTLDLQVVRTGTLSPSSHVDGILCMLGGFNSRPEFARFVRTMRVPAVDLHQDLANLRIPRVVADNAAIGRLAARHFLERGFTHLAYACRSLREDYSMRERFRGFREELTRQGKQAVLLDCAAGIGRQPVRSMKRCAEWLARQLATLPKPTAVFAENDDFALAVMDACSINNLLIPEEVAVLGCGNESLVCEFAPIPLSSVQLDLVARSYLAAQTLDRLMQGRSVSLKPRFIPPLGIETRRSTDIIAVNDRRVAIAIDFIRRRYTDPALGISDIAQAAGASVNTLLRAFRRELNRSIGQELRLVRLEHARQLMSAGGLSATDAAAKSGFSGLLHLRRTLHQQTGLTPQQWKRSQQQIRPVST